MSFVYSRESPVVQHYMLWLELQQKADKKRCRLFAFFSLLFLVSGIVIPLGGIYFFHISTYLWGICPFFLILAGILMTDDVRGKIYFDFVGAVIFQYSSLSEFDIGKYEQHSMMIRNDVEEQKLLYCLRVSTNLPKYKKIDIILSRWQAVLEHGLPYFTTSPRGKLTFDFLSQIYVHHAHKVFSDYATSQSISLFKLKTDLSKKRRLEKIKENLVNILSQNSQFPRLQELVNATYKAIIDTQPELFATTAHPNQKR